MTRKCILFPGESPLFVHVRLAFDQFFRHKEDEIQLLPYGEADDAGISDCVHKGVYTRGSEQYEVIAGICDPYPAIAKGLTVTAAVLKRLPFLFLAHRKANFNGMFFRMHYDSQSTITLDSGGPQHAASPRSTGQSLSRELSGALGGLKTNTRDHPFEEPTEPVDGQTLVITANLSKAFEQRRLKEVCIYPVADYFPEWSRCLTSALVIRGEPASEVVRQFKKALDAACLYVRYHMSREDLGSFIRNKYFHGDAILAQCANDIADFLLRARPKTR